VIDLLGVHRADNAHVVRHAADVREEGANLLARLAEAREVVQTAETFQLLALKLRDLLPLRERLGHRLPVHLPQLRLGIEHLQVRRTAGLVEVNDAFDLRGVVQRVNDPAPRIRLAGRRPEELRAQERVERHRAQTGGGSTQESAARELLRVGFDWIHNVKVLGRGR
jgi:hypothetical protein